MKIGILSDTHGNLARAIQSVQQLLNQGCGTLIHCGDVGSENVLIEMTALLHGKKVPAFVVLGNVDLWDEAVQQFPASSGIQVARSHDLELEGCRMGVAHGDDPRLFASFTGSGDYRYVFTGHTHVREDRSTGNTRIINPGAVYRTPQPSIAVLDLATDELRFMDLM